MMKKRRTWIEKNCHYDTKEGGSVFACSFFMQGDTGSPHIIVYFSDANQGQTFVQRLCELLAPRRYQKIVIQVGLTCMMIMIWGSMLLSRRMFIPQIRGFYLSVLSVLLCLIMVRVVTDVLERRYGKRADTFRTMLADYTQLSYEHGAGMIVDDQLERYHAWYTSRKNGWMKCLRRKHVISAIALGVLISMLWLMRSRFGYRT